MTGAERLVEALGGARLDNLPLTRCTEPLDRTAEEADAYALQERLARWLCAHGQGRIAGYKIGATTAAMQSLLGVSGPVYGHILSANVLTAPAMFACNPQCGPGVECEIAFRLGVDLDPASAPFDRARVADGIDAALTAIEIVENRYGDFRQRSLALLTADDFFHKACVVGEPVIGWHDLDLRRAASRLSVNGEPTASGIGSDVLGDPLAAVVWLADRLAERNSSLKAGQIVLTGSTTPVHWIGALPAEIHVEIDGLGPCAVVLNR